MCSGHEGITGGVNVLREIWLSRSVNAFQEIWLNDVESHGVSVFHEK